ncbi:chromate efflux transporter [Agrobacterium vitis]|uniref:Chromate efflux transporter n=2 Tax=Agrobacterium vitis TaxID=373 RepID=A0A368P1Q0_AGRVI|nr:chromate efflux transporter [Agrobacterium vitis]KAA3530439.1 chromate efflux transporter [Agrobacterium vitis]MCF1476293.1 chromate efflux transporter [Agrobacterium vitis]MUZ98931.1 chromate efflux transporter [Agrobacterium vitis]MVA31512.1 chromate efflux transporter [Agrobacterium vitis]
MAKGQEHVPVVPLGTICAVFWSVGLLSFGGPAAQIALMHRIVVDEKRWLSEARFLHALNYCMLLPGPEAQQLATYIGWLNGGIRGGLIAGLLFVLPGLAVMIGLSAAYALYHDIAWVSGLFFGLKAAVLAIVLQALLRIGGRALKSTFHRLVAAVAFFALFCLALPFPVVVLLAALAGLIRAYGQPVPTSEPGAVKIPLNWWHMALSLLGWAGLWLAPLALLALFDGSARLTEIFLFFARMALVTFGGAYAVLAYVAQVAVEHYQWLRPGEMVDGLALAETTPGPLVLVLSFVGFLAAFRDADSVMPLISGMTGALLTAWATFVPSFVFIFAGAPLIERLRGNRLADGALSAITAAVVGVICNLAVWFGLHVLFAKVDRIPFSTLWPGERAPGLWWPQLASLDIPSLLLFAGSALLLMRLKIGMVTVMGLAAVAGLVWNLETV